MQENFEFEPVEMEDISSTSSEFRKQNDGPITVYGNGIAKNLGGIIKAIGFILAFVIIAVSFVIAYFLFSTEKFFMAISLAIIILGTVSGVIILFLIYGLGQIICQNNEILRRLNK